VTFQIDTGATAYGYGQINYSEAMLDAARDSLPDDASQGEIDAALARLIVADLIAPKTAKTARLHFARYWPLINAMNPESYDWVLQEYAERLAELR
jgi:hypothetical protein